MTHLATKKDRKRKKKPRFFTFVLFFCIRNKQFDAFNFFKYKHKMRNPSKNTKDD